MVGALATAEACRVHGAEPVVGGVSWERRPIDPQPGPRAESEIEGARRLAPGVMAASAGTRVRESGVLFAESRMAELLGEETVLVDATLGPAQLADGIAAAAASLGVDLIVFVDVGGDALAHGDEPGLASPLCDALLLAAAARLAERGGAARARRHLRHRLRRRADAARGARAARRGRRRRWAGRRPRTHPRRRAAARGGGEGGAHRGERSGAALLPRRDRPVGDPPGTADASSSRRRGRSRSTSTPSRPFARPPAWRPR